MKGGSEAEFLEQHREGLTRLRQKLAKNEAAILAHLSAVNEVATLLQNAIQRARNRRHLLRRRVRLGENQGP